MSLEQVSDRELRPKSDTDEEAKPSSLERDLAALSTALAPVIRKAMSSAAWMAAISSFAIQVFGAIVFAATVYTVFSEDRPPIPDKQAVTILFSCVALILGAPLAGRFVVPKGPDTEELANEAAKAAGLGPGRMRKSLEQGGKGV